MKINLGFLRKPLQFSIHHSSFIIFAISTSPKFLRSPFFQTAKLIRKVQQAVAVQKTAHGPGHDQLPIVGAMYRIEHWIHSLEHEIEVCFFHTRLPSVGFVSQLDRTRGGLVPYSFLCVFAGPPSVKVDPGTDARDSYQSVSMSPISRRKQVAPQAPMPGMLCMIFIPSSLATLSMVCSFNVPIMS